MYCNPAGGFETLPYEFIDSESTVSAELDGPRGRKDGGTP